MKEFLITNSNANANLRAHPDGLLYYTGTEVGYSSETPYSLYVIEGLPQVGEYNKIHYSSQSQRLCIERDVLGKLPLYFYERNNIFAVTNNFWLLPKIFGFSALQLNNRKLAQLFFSISLIAPDTVFDRVKTLHPGRVITLHIQPSGFEKKEEITWNIKEKILADPVITSTETAVVLLDHSFAAYAEKLARWSENKTFGFGNSGGVDSRILGAYLSKHIDLTPFVYLDNKTNRLSGTAVASKKIAEALSLTPNFVQMASDNPKESMMRDLRVNPFHRSQLFKNSLSELPSFDVLVTGQDECIFNDKAINVDSRDDLNKIGFSCIKGSEFLAKKAGFDLTNEAILDRLTEETDIYDMKSLYRYWYLTSLSRFSRCGGFESLSRTREAIFFYDNSALNLAFDMSYGLKENRRILKELVRLHHPSLFQIKHQDGSFLGEEKRSFKTRLRSRALGSGMSYNKFKKDASFKAYYSEIMEIDSNLFDEVFSGALRHSKEVYDALPGKQLCDLLKVKQLCLDIECNDQHKYTEPFYLG